MEYLNFFDYIENIENKNVFNYICELGAQLNDFERNDARMILNDLSLNGRDDYWICIAFIRILGKGSFSQWKYLLNYEPFIKENDWLYDTYEKKTLKEKIQDLDLYVGYGAKDVNFTDEESNDLTILYDISTSNNVDLNDYKDFINYYFYKFYLTDECLKTSLEIIYYSSGENAKFKKWYRGLSVGEKRDLINAGLLKS